VAGGEGGQGRAEQAVAEIDMGEEHGRCLSAGGGGGNL
jgi:hypothetical protein